MPDAIKTAAPGSLVFLVHAKIRDAVVISVTVRSGGHVTYEVAWWANGSRQTATLDQSEVGFLEGEQPETLSIGFKAGN